MDSFDRSTPLRCALALLALALLVALPSGPGRAAAPEPMTPEAERAWEERLADAFLAGVNDRVPEGGGIAYWWRGLDGRRERIDRARLARLLAGCRRADRGQTVSYGVGPWPNPGERGVGIWMTFTCTGPDATAPVLAIEFGFGRRRIRRIQVAADVDMHAYR